MQISTAMKLVMNTAELSPAGDRTWRIFTKNYKLCESHCFFEQIMTHHSTLNDNIHNPEPESICPFMTHFPSLQICYFSIIRTIKARTACLQNFSLCRQLLHWIQFYFVMSESCNSCCRRISSAKISINQQHLKVLLNTLSQIKRFENNTSSISSLSQTFFVPNYDPQRYYLTREDQS